jgi:hypothetical protein
MFDLIWWIILFLQGASFTWVSRARNSGSIKYAAFAGITSHALWFLSQIFIVTSVIDLAKDGDLPQILWSGFIFVSSMVSGQIAMMYASLKYFEKGKRQVGAR